MADDMARPNPIYLRRQGQQLQASASYRRYATYLSSTMAARVARKAVAASKQLKICGWLQNDVSSNWRWRQNNAVVGCAERRVVEGGAVVRANRNVLVILERARLSVTVCGVG